MKIKNKGKVHPTPSSSSVSSASSASDGFVLSVLQLLPAAILALASVLSLEDREVLAYLITRSMKTIPIVSSSIPAQDPKKKSSKKGPNNKSTAATTHQPPMFDCDCFDCYRSYWFKWDSSPNRELIHQAIEAFEDHLAHGEKPKKNAGRGKRRDKLGRRDPAKPADVTAQNDVFPEEKAPASLEILESSVFLPEDDIVLVGSPEKADDVEAYNMKVEDLGLEVNVEPPETVVGVAVIVRAAAASSHRGLARKVLPDVLGLFNSRLWNLWSPNV